MSYVNPAIRDKFESMPIDLKNAILSMDVKLEIMSDLMACLERIIAEARDMLDHAALTPEALSYFQSLRLSYQVAMNHSNLSFRTLEDLKAYEERNLQGTDSVLYQRLPDPAIPSNSALDPLMPSSPIQNKKLVFWQIPSCILSRTVLI